MSGAAATYTQPTLRFTRWLVDPGPAVPDEIGRMLAGSLFSSLPVFAAGLVNTLLVAALCALWRPEPAFIAWFAAEALICLCRALVLVKARRAAAAGTPTPTDLHILLALLWSANVGYGTFISLTSGDWPVAALASLSATAMIGGICFRNFAAPRMTVAMILLSLGPLLAGALLSGEWLLLIVTIQVPLYVFGMGSAAFRMRAMLVSTMMAERDSVHRARHDALTGLMNRAGLIDALQARIARGRAGQAPFALLYLDLDGFKAVNDGYGHATGDVVLQAVARRLDAASRIGDLTARLGGDEFVVVADGLDETAALAVGERLIAKLARTYDLGEGRAAAIGVSIGIACFPAHGTDMATLLARADAALYLAKAKGKSRCALASEEGALTRPLHGLAEKAAGGAGRKGRSAA